MNFTDEEVKDLVHWLQLTSFSVFTSLAAIIVSIIKFISNETDRAVILLIIAFVGFALSGVFHDKVHEVLKNVDIGKGK